ncbi:MAG TPA: hypothetical protein VEX86_25240 [Longimicrobium sp.]|nr:hypothetical protein [Longimicrobium sp.]
MTHFRSLREAARPTAARLALVFLCAAAASTLAPTPAAAQQPLAGRVLRDGQGVPGVRVQLHRVTRVSRGQIDSTVSGPGGRFSLRLPAADTAAGFTVFFSTAVADGVRYFGPAIHPEQEAEEYAIAVYDTASSQALADSVRVSRRDVFLIPDANGAMQVAEILRVRNPARRTLVAEGRPRVSVTLPPGLEAFEAGEGDRADSAQASNTGLARVGDRAWLTDPLVPGDRDFFFRYRLPAKVKQLPVALGRATDTLFVYVRQPAPDVSATGLGEGTPFTAEGDQFIRYMATALGPGAPVSVDWRGPRPPPVDPRWAALAIAGAILAAGVVVAARRSRGAAAG